MSELCLSSEQYWAELQGHASDELITRVGSLWFGQNLSGTQEGGINGAMETMDALGIPYQPLDDAAAIEGNFQFQNLPTDYYGFYQADGGSINLKATEQTLFNSALGSGMVSFLEWQNVVNIDAPATGDITVTTNAVARIPAPRFSIAVKNWC